MTTVENRNSTATQDAPRAPAPADWLVQPERRVPRTRRLLPVSWPLTALLVLYPLWWALGLSIFIVPGVAVVMAYQLSRRGGIRLPPGFGLWVIGVFLAAFGAIMLRQQPPGAQPLTGHGPYLVFLLRFVNYCAITVVWLYVGNMSERELPRRQVVRQLGFFFLITVLGGFAGMLFPHRSFFTLTGRVMPEFVTQSTFGQQLFTISLAQVQDVLGSGSDIRPAAPFFYTNMWGEMLSLTLVWFVVSWWVYGRRWQRFLAPLIVAVSLVPVVFSLNRGVWVGLAVSVVYVLFRFALSGRVAPLGALVLVTGLATAVFLASPLSGVVAERLAHPHSNATRSSLAIQSVKAAWHSPVIGYGSTRQQVGSNQTIAVGPTQLCPRCGSRDIGSTGHLWFLLIAQGFVGALAYVAWLLRVLWRYRRDSTPVGVAGGLTIVLMLVYMWVYEAIAMPLCVAVIAMALLWRNERTRRAARAGAT